ncbi:MAG: type III-B CRISPR module-associated Cmr3 family protein [Bacillota bacterium]|jgi:CRISPR-associated protein Cmr3
MSERTWSFRALDTLFFRGGMPFDAGEWSSRGVRSTFPPSMRTIQGAVRAALAVGQGWKPNKEFPVELGDSESLGKLKLKGPYIHYKDNYLYPVPAILLEGGNGIFRLKPGPEMVSTDIGVARLPELVSNSDRPKPIEGKWITAIGLSKVLGGGIPAPTDFISVDSLWLNEGRTGIEINRSSRTADAKKLYHTFHVRPKDGLSINITVDGVPDSWHERTPQYISLGGENRYASITISDKPVVLPKNVSFPGKGKHQFTVTLITPGIFKDDTSSVLTRGPLSNLTCITACVPKLFKEGGWDRRHDTPRPMIPVIPAGSTWFYEEEMPGSEIESMHCTFVGADNEYGYGQIIIGKWRG